MMHDKCDDAMYKGYELAKKEAIKIIKKFRPKYISEFILKKIVKDINELTLFDNC